MHWLESHSPRAESSHARQHGVNNTTIRQRRDYQTPVVLKIKATRASVKALRGYEHVGAAVSPLVDQHKHTTT